MSLLCDKKEGFGRVRYFSLEEKYRKELQVSANEKSLKGQMGAFSASHL
jgi:hypothetical protein